MPAARQPTTRSLRQSVWIGLCGAGILVALLILYAFPPGKYGFYPVCGTYAFLGIHCPGCGSLRAIHQLTHGQVLAALHDNALLVLGLGTGLAWCVYCRVRHGTWQSAMDRIRPSWMWWAGAMILVFGVARNLPWYPFTVLAP